jgi:hypothetical protein
VNESHPGTDDQRKTLKQFYRDFELIRRERDRIQAQPYKVLLARTTRGMLKATIIEPKLPEYPAYPSECLGMSCGAKTRKRMPCRQTNIYQNGRCKYHGGASTGPRTKKGKKRSARNGLRPKRRDKSKIQARLSSTEHGTNPM